ncbi:hypothetical protein MAUB1S_11450 [Mycolicibacterium aubagnense]
MQSHNSYAAEMRPIDEVIPYERNPRVIPESAVLKVAASIREFGWRQPIVVDDAGVILVGHTRRLAALHLGLTMVPVHVAVGLSPAKAKAYRLADNRVGEETSWDLSTLELELDELGGVDFDLDELGLDAALLSGLDLDVDEAAQRVPNVSLMDRFGVAPFTVLNARDGWWQDRKRAWLAIGIESELGRGENALRFSKTVLAATAPKAVR